MILRCEKRRDDKSLIKLSFETQREIYKRNSDQKIESSRGCNAYCARREDRGFIIIFPRSLFPRAASRVSCRETSPISAGTR